MRTANCGQRAIKKSHIILKSQHDDEIIAAGRWLIIFFFSPNYFVA